MTGMASKLDRLADRVDVLSLRERVVLFGGALAVLSFVMIQFVLEPMNASHKQIKDQLERRSAEALALQTQFEILGRQYAEDPNAGHRQRLKELETRLVTLQDSLAGLTAGLVSPVEMARLVEQVLSRNRGLKVLEVSSLTDVPLVGNAETEQPAANPKPESPADQQVIQAPLHKHGLRLRLQGRYRDLVAYLADLERLPWKVFWGKAALTAGTWPQSELELVIFTLSRDAAWIGT